MPDATAAMQQPLFAVTVTELGDHEGEGRDHGESQATATSMTTQVDSRLTEVKL